VGYAARQLADDPIFLGLAAADPRGPCAQLTSSTIDMTPRTAPSLSRRGAWVHSPPDQLSGPRHVLAGAVRTEVVGRIWRPEAGLAVPGLQCLDELLGAPAHGFRSRVAENAFRCRIPLFHSPIGSQTMQPVGINSNSICRRASLLLSASAARLRAVMSRETPMRPMILPFASRRGAFTVRQVRVCPPPVRNSRAFGLFRSRALVRRMR